MADRTKELEAQELETIKNQLSMMGIEFPQNAKLATLKEILNKELRSDSKDEDKAVAPKGYYDDPMELIRCSIVCRNPNKSTWKGQYVTCGDAGIGHHTVFVPFNCDQADDTYLPRIVVDLLKSKEYVELFNKPNYVDGNLSGLQNGFKTVPEFVITILSDDMPASKEFSLNY